jgi:hypothetical protein
MMISSLNEPLDAEKARWLHANPKSFASPAIAPQITSDECSDVTGKPGEASKKLGFTVLPMLKGYFPTNKRHETGANDCGAKKVRNRIS